MELPIAVFVVVVTGAALVGLVAGLATARWHGRSRTPAVSHVEGKEQAGSPDPSATVAGSSELEEELDSAEARISKLEAELSTSNAELVKVGDQAAIAKRELADLKARFSDIVGLEAENSTLRSIASRVPDLERRLAELEANEPRVIDLREAPAQSS